MAAAQEKLAESLKKLKEYQDAHRDACVIQGQDTLGAVHTKRLLQNGYLQCVIKGWYIASTPGNEGDTAPWYSSYWQFVTAYSNSHFGDEWSLTAEESIAYHAGALVAPKQVIIRSPRASNNVTPLPFGDSILAIVADIPKNKVVEEKYGLHVYSLAEALVCCSPQCFRADALNVRTCLFSLGSADDIIRLLIDGGNTSKAARLIGAFRETGRGETADRIKETMKRMGHTVREENPFAAPQPTFLSSPQSPHATRILLLWEQEREQLLNMNVTVPQTVSDETTILSGMDANFVRDSYHSLSIEGYRVTEELIRRVQSGDWNPADNQEDADRKNALAARGYYQAFQKVKESVLKIVHGQWAGDVVAKDFDSWHFELFQPSVTAGIITTSDLVGYRSHQVVIRGSRHTPPSPEAVRDAMPVFCECIRNEKNPFVRAVLGHHLFVYIHPYMDGNGRTARFIMNSLFVTAGYPWTIVPIERRQEYMASLEKASTQGDITDFANLLLSLHAKH